MLWVRDGTIAKDTSHGINAFDECEIVNVARKACVVYLDCLVVGWLVVVFYFIETDS